MTGFEKPKVIKEKGESNGNISACPRTSKTTYSPLGKCNKAVFIAVGSVVLNLILTAIIVVLGRARTSPPALPTCPTVSCPWGWVEYQGKCYYFSNEEGNWTSSKMYCSSLNAALAVVDSQEEMDFMMRYKGIPDHWIGLQRNPTEPWKWISGTIFNGWFEIPGRGYCACMKQQGIISSSCSRETPWICSKPVGR